MFKVLLFVLLFMTTSAFAETTFAPNGKKDRNLTVNSVVIDMRKNEAWKIYTPTACKYRTMSTVTKAGLTRTIPANSFVGHYTVNAKTPFFNATGCTNGEMQIQ